MKNLQHNLFSSGIDAAGVQRRCSGIIEIEGRRYATSAGLARILGVSPRTLSRWEEKRIGPPRTKIGSLLLFDLAKIPLWLDQHEKTPLRR